MMFPSMRGGNDNPAPGRLLRRGRRYRRGRRFLAARPYVDPHRIYLGGHSTGGTMVMIVAELTDRFRATFAFGPADDVRSYPPEYRPFDDADPRAVQLRSPGYWLDSVRSPLFVFEGTGQPGNLSSLQEMARQNTNHLVHFIPVAGASHFSILAPTNEQIAFKVLKDTGSTTNLAFSEAELRVEPKAQVRGHGPGSGRSGRASPSPNRRLPRR